MTMHVDLVSPERILYQGEADTVVSRTVGGGDVAFMTGHAPFVGALEICTVTIRSESGDEAVAVHGGFVEVSENRVTILSDVAELASQIDVERAREAKARAERQLDNEHDVEAEAALRRAHVRLVTAGASP